MIARRPTAGNFEVGLWGFRLAGATCCTDDCDSKRGEVDCMLTHPCTEVCTGRYFQARPCPARPGPASIDTFFSFRQPGALRMTYDFVHSLVTEKWWQICYVLEVESIFIARYRRDALLYRCICCGPMSVRRLSVCPSVTSRPCTTSAKRSSTKTTGTVVA